MTWICVKSGELPDQEEFVLVAQATRAGRLWVWVGYLDDGQWRDPVEGDLITVTHWMPLPAPPLLKFNPAVVPSPTP